MKIKTWATVLLLSLAAHSVVIYRFMTEGILFSGKGDSIAQMIPFQLYLYEQFSKFNFFYDMGFGIGGDFFRSLAYYYSTSPIAYLNFGVIYILDLFLPLNTGSPDFWFVNQFMVSFFKLAAIIYITYRLFRLLGINRYASMASAFLYGYSTVYFFFTFTWSFFSDVMFYLPLTIYGMERFFSERKIGIFIVGIALTLHSNFYFSYYQFIFVLFYFSYRTLYHKKSDVVRWQTKVAVIIIASFIGLAISAVGFSTGVTSYLLNDRTLPPIKLKPFIDFIIHYNLFYDGYYAVIPFLTVMALSTFRLYRNYTFRLFAVITWLFMAGSLSPLFDSFFNGFSIDQRRWVYMLVFSSAGVIAVYLQHLKSLTLKEVTVSLIPVTIIYSLSIIGAGKSLVWLLFIPVIVIIIMLYIQRGNKSAYQCLILTIIVMNLFFVYDYMREQIDTLHPFEERNLSFVQSDKYNSEVQRSIISKIKAENPASRIDWQTSATHNTPLYQHFNGIKLYSSIFDKDIYQFYDKELNVTMDTDSNSIYYRLGERANLYSLFNVDHSIRTGNPATLPYGFELTDTRHGRDKDYEIYRNTYQLPNVRVTDNIYNVNELNTPLDREHAMLTGVVLNQPSNSRIEPARNLLNQTEMRLNNATYEGETLVVSKEQGGLVLKLPDNISDQYKDLYVDLSIELKTPSRYHYVWINEIYQSRKPLDDDYRRFNPRITMRIKADKLIQLKLMTGTYHVKVNGIYAEDYQTLKKAVNQPRHTLTEQRNKLTAHLKPHSAGYAVIPVPYLNGMEATVDGKKAEVKEGNYLMTAIKVNQDAKEVSLTYTPPYFHLYQLISIVGIVIAIWYSSQIRRKNKISALSNEKEINIIASPAE
ncbi:hypothetical protein ERX37_03670 [Macrococcus hajekii]|uniref:YfhO family protein n=1 Tax=Macrococcus hajekii TaxID=198482 RepID=A0A4V3BEC7_9STAP|nr:YfhO family protein [Macrococcus hajekii]TDM03195.1 hypothetical protein ERX37_03670 [Macrococcus hajekii]GGA96787.1 membrane protein [Macrococcus hajekii]